MALLLPCGFLDARADPSPRTGLDACRAGGGPLPRQGADDECAPHSEDSLSGFHKPPFSQPPPPKQRLFSPTLPHPTHHSSPAASTEQRAEANTPIPPLPPLRRPCAADARAQMPPASPGPCGRPARAASTPYGPSPQPCPRKRILDLSARQQTAMLRNNASEY
ncbi:hypothetical protein NDU88_003545 [Pleurodeles waltl]|uniref:Uncharacterized protein n=1 Tax=Pleurodeles waltl TaxID=8319 RepID=A0AAV7M7A7_PLEWA|nr:hypothetical protein NDU88_003545 [Pleurodeles waltl]